MEKSFFLGFDLGAESGRTILGRLQDGRILTRELTRFANAPVQVFGNLHWNVYGLFEEIKKGMAAGLAEAADEPLSLAVDTWGVDFGLLSPDGTILGLPYAYRDERTRGVTEEVFERLPRSEIYERTGIQFLPFNTLFQLHAAVKQTPGLIKQAGALLFMPDLFGYLLTGQKASEFTIASTSQLLDPRAGSWDGALLAAIGVPSGLMQNIVSPGSLLGSLSPDVSRETGLAATRVIATASHDTAAAVAAVPASGEGWAYISSGTWSLMGVELDSPLINPDVEAANFPNEGGVAGSTRFLKNIAGLWLLRECRREGLEPASLMMAQSIGWRGSSLWSLHRPRLPGLPEPAEYGGSHPRFLPPHGPKTSSFTSPNRALHSRKPGPEIPPDSRRTGASHREIDRPDSRHRRREPQRDALPVYRRCHSPAGLFGTGRGHGHREYHGPGPGHGSGWNDRRHPEDHP
jgi:sugar (pentulose or hexulose) kinase